jgi:hypothetical protein
MKVVISVSETFYVCIIRGVDFIIFDVEVFLNGMNVLKYW